MPKTTQATAIAPDDSAITLSLTAAQLKALGLGKLPAPGAEVHIRASATVAHPQDAADPDQDGGAGADTDGDGADDAGTGDSSMDRGGTDHGSMHGDTGNTAALTLHLSGLTLMPVHRTPDKVLYGSGD